MKTTRLWIIGLIALVAGIALFLLGQFGAARLSESLELLWRILRDLGIALGAAGFVVATVDRVTARHLSKQMQGFINQLREDVLFARFDRVVPKQITAEISKHVIEDRILYQRFQVTTTLREEDPAGSSLVGDSVAKFEVKNDSDEHVPWGYFLRMSDLASGKPPSPNTVTRFSAKSKNPANCSELRAVDLKADVKVDDQLGIVDFKKSFSLVPHETLEISVTRHVRVRSRDTYNLTVRHPTVSGMTLEVHFPAGFKVDCTFAHPGQEDGDKQCSFNQDGNVAIAEIRGGVLPYQGIVMSWVRDTGDGSDK